MMMMQRKSSRDNRVAMIRPLLEEAEDLIDEEEIERAPTEPMQMVETIAAVQTTDSVTVTVNSARHRQRLVRRSSSAVERITIPPVQEEKKNGGDKSLRPRFLQERSATIVHITPAAIGPSRVPRSKASAFLLDVLAKSKGLSGTESRRASLEPLRHAPGVTNTLHYVPPQGVERGVPLRMAGRSSRRFGRLLSVGPSSDFSEEGTPTGSKKRCLSASQEHMAAIMRGLQANKQHLQQQLNILHSVLRFINATERDEEGKRPVLKEMIDEGMIPELASIMREFRFDTGLQVCIMSILSALAEESPVYAYMMNELNLGTLIQKTTAVHATHDRLIFLASNLVHAIEESKNTVNIPAYQAEKAAKFRRQSASYTDMIVAAITAKPKQSATVSPPSSAKSSKAATSRRTCQEGIVATEIARSLSFIKSASSCGSECERMFSAGKTHQGFDLNVAPPALSANYRLLFSQTLKKAEIQPLRIAEGDTTNVMHADNYNAKRDRPASSPAKKSLALDLTSKSLVAAIYSGSSIFVEPSPLTKRMPFRGSMSAGGVRRKLSVPKKFQHAHTERLPPTQVSTTMSSPQPPPMPERSISLFADTLDAPVLDDMPIVADELSESSEGELKEESEVQKAQEEQEEIKAEEKDDEDEYEDESYEDDFDTTDDDTDEDKTMPNRKDSTQIGSDSELIDMLNDISVQDSESSAYLPTLKSKETEAATTIQRHVREVLVRREFPPPGKTQSCKNAVHQPEKKTSTITNGGSSNRRRSSKVEQRKAKRIPLSTRNLHTHGRNSVRGETMPQLTSRSRPMMTPLSVSKKSGNSAKSVGIGAQHGSTCQQPNQEPNKQFSKRVASPSQQNSPLQTLSLVTSSSEVDPEHETVDTQEVKTPLGPAALKQVQALYVEGLNHHKENHLGLAIECYEKALAIPGGEHFASLHVNLGSALMAQNKFLEALESFKQAKCIQPSNTKAIYNYALALLHLDQVPEAQRLLRHLLELEPNHEKAVIALSRLPGNVSSPEPKVDR